MLVVALTGGIGSGKTTVSDIFKSKNIPVIDTDIIARQLVEKDKPAYKKIIKLFGEEILDKDKNINRAKLRQLIFSCEEKRLQLEALLHPLIWQEVISQLESLNSAYCIVVVPLLFETASKDKKLHFDRIASVDITPEMQIKRVKARNNIDEKTINNILNSQVSRQTRLNAADDIISNTGSFDQLNQEVRKLHLRYLELSK